jgi:lipoprotein-releasing system ATP-binding protein
MLSLRALSKYYGDAGRKLTVINELNFDFAASGSVAIIGRSGIGKSTLLHILGGLDRPSAGQVVLDGVELGSLDADELARIRGKKVGFVFQFHHLLPEFTALENAAMPLLIAGESEQQAMQQASSALERVGLADRADHRPGELSGGEQQRVAVARAIVSSPRVLLADEPTGNLDEQTARLVQDLLLAIQREQKSLLIVVTHSRELAAAMDERIEMQPGGELRRV